MILKQSFPRLTPELLDKTDAILKEKFGYSPLPEDYRRFMLQQNGGFVSPGFIDDTDDAHTQEIVFDTPLTWARDNNRPVTPCLIMFFGIWLEDMQGADIENEELYDLVLSNEHSRYDFDVLPDNMMSIAKCSYPDAADMLCLSLGGADYGAVYYNYGMCDHPAKFHGNYYEEKAKLVFEKHGITADELDEETEEGQRVVDDLKRATFVKIADSFEEFLRSCKIAPVP
ncbi:MAG TPA: SMI1/KNR4 family protein [Chitinophaga sp.]|uniref:SMI1/KNR4 family protein n=1 Tax=Chitinophaga sp. TaxID=1869181 RepID=UPI002CD49BC6|nr:SMI1/KNR4 family protein [Chitinophaga sp.]HVI44823.1 SMI1/KNR4 family protein [Chitinophaga sp.]